MAQPVVYDAIPPAVRAGANRYARDRRRGWLPSRRDERLRAEYQRLLKRLRGGTRRVSTRRCHPDDGDGVRGMPGAPDRTRVHGAVAPVDLFVPGPGTVTRSEYYALAGLPAPELAS